MKCVCFDKILEVRTALGSIKDDWKHFKNAQSCRNEWDLSDGGLRSFFF